MKTQRRAILACVAAVVGVAAMAPSWAEGGDGEGRAKAKPDRAEKSRDRADEPDKADRGERAAKREKVREKDADKREARQAKRIEHGIKKGALTSDEIDTLTEQQQKIADMEASFKGDGKLSRKESKQLNEALNAASRNIWGEKHDKDGKQLAVYRLGDNVFAKDDFTKKMADPNLSKQDARKLTHDFRQITSLKRSLSADDLTPEQRAKKQSEFDELVNQYFEARTK